LVTACDAVAAAAVAEVTDASAFLQSVVFPLTQKTLARPSKPMSASVVGAVIPHPADVR
jgi:hypothetical protein